MGFFPSANAAAASSPLPALVGVLPPHPDLGSDPAGTAQGGPERAAELPVLSSYLAWVLSSAADPGHITPPL